MTHTSKLIHRQGDLLALAEAGEFTMVVHGCNCFCTMGGGIAAQIAKRYPSAYRADCKTDTGDFNKLGTFTYVNTDKFTIINAYTQFNMSRGEDVFEYTAFELILQKLGRYKNHKIGIPYIGMGLAGGDKDRIIKIIENFADTVGNNNTVTLVEFV